MHMFDVENTIKTPLKINLLNNFTEYFRLIHIKGLHKHKNF